eukprot:1950338-Alexandrium_andersonii.AAC.1
MRPAPGPPVRECRLAAPSLPAPGSLLGLPALIAVPRMRLRVNSFLKRPSDAGRDNALPACGCRRPR